MNECRNGVNEWMSRSVETYEHKIAPHTDQYTPNKGQHNPCHFFRWIFWRSRNSWHQICPFSLQTEFGCYSSFSEAWDSIFCQGRWWGETAKCDYLFLKIWGWQTKEGWWRGKSQREHILCVKSAPPTMWWVVGNCRPASALEMISTLRAVSLFSKIACVKHSLNEHCIKWYVNKTP